MAFETLKSISRKLEWSLFGFMLAAVFGGITIYSEFFRDDRPSIQFEIISNSSVLDVREEIADLEIIHAGTDLRGSGQSLRVLVVRVSNIGGEDILNSYYDSSAPLGFSVENGELISAEVQSASEAYLETQVQISIRDLSQVIFSPVILGTDSYFFVRVLVIHTESMLPRITPIGRVARVRSISLVEAQAPQAGGFWRQTFGGSVLNQIIRLLAYPVAIILLGVSIVWPVVTLSSAVEKRRRKRKVELFEKNSGHDFLDEYSFLFENYISRGSYFLKQVDSLLSDRVDLDDIVKSVTNTPEDVTDISESIHVREVEFYGPMDKNSRRWYYSFGVKSLLKAGVIERGDEHYKVNSRFKKIFREFQSFLSLVAE